jgi:hypothetical protein
MCDGRNYRVLPAGVQRLVLLVAGDSGIVKHTYVRLSSLIALLSGWKA